MLFNDDLIPLEDFLDPYRDSPFSMVYIYACCNSDFSAADRYMYSEFQQPLLSSDCTSWIRRSTGRLCTELNPNSDSVWLDWTSPEFPALSRKYSRSASTETITAFIDSLTLEQYHFICAWNLRQYRHFDLSAFTTMNPGAVYHCSNDLLKDSTEIASLPTTEASPLDDWMISGGGTGEVMPDGWTRFQSSDVFDNTLSLSFSIYRHRKWHTWLSQANHIFHHLHIMSNFEDYSTPSTPSYYLVCLYRIEFELRICGTTEDFPPGFLFSCPREDFLTGLSSFRYPICTAYWSLDPSGVDRLSLEEATRLGFPSFDLSTSAAGCYWDASVYEGLHQFHEAKGFDPYSHDVARHLGLPIFQLSSQHDASVESDGEVFDADIDCNSASENYELEYPPSSVCTDFQIGPQAVSHEEDVRETAGPPSGPEHTSHSNCENHNTSEPIEEDMVAEEMFTPSGSMNVLMSIQIALILFLGLYWLYDHVPGSFV
ncbi:hypothetical protein C8R45DRAFT_911857 [Mycena sanguinolenta]|nr:hypothetical protein C8R45DRAFT_911857 [Mycena sanguinolenta]